MRHSRTTQGEGRAADIELVDDLDDEALRSSIAAEFTVYPYDLS